MRKQNHEKGVVDLNTERDLAPVAADKREVIATTSPGSKSKSRPFIAVFGEFISIWYSGTNLRLYPEHDMSCALDFSR